MDIANSTANPNANPNLDPDPNRDPRTEAAELNQAIRQGVADRSTGAGATVDDGSDRMAAGAPTTPDPDALTEQAKVVGEEAVGGPAPTPEQDNVDDLAAAAGVPLAPDEPVAVKAELHDRDRQRWELNPDSAQRPSPDA